MRTSSLIALAVLMTTAAFGCGGSDSGSGASNEGALGSPSAQTTVAKSGQDTQSSPQSNEHGAVSKTVSPSATPTPQEARQIEVLRDHFPAPKPKRTIEGAAKAIVAGEDACRGKTPLQVKEEFYDEARGNFEPGQDKMLAELPDYENEARLDPSFVAGQLGAMVYEMTQPPPVQSSGFQGCIYQLARQLESELGGAPRSASRP